MAVEPPTDGKSSPSESQTLDGEHRLDPEDLKMVAKRLVMKLSRFVTLGAIYYTYLVFQDLPALNLWGFPVIYAYVWAGITAFIGLFLFILGRPTLLDDSVTSFLIASHFSYLKLLCDGTIYRYFCILLNWLYPYVVTSTWCCYSRTKIRHSRFVLYYFAFLTVVEMKKLRQLQYFAHMLIIGFNFYVCLLAGNLWGYMGAVLMVVNLKLIMENESEALSLGWNMKIGKPLLFAVSSMACSYVVTQSIQVMTGMVDGYDQDLPHITTDRLLDGLNPLIFATAASNNAEESEV